MVHDREDGFGNQQSYYKTNQCEDERFCQVFTYYVNALGTEQPSRSHLLGPFSSQGEIEVDIVDQG